MATKVKTPYYTERHYNDAVKMIAATCGVLRLTSREALIVANLYADRFEKDNKLFKREKFMAAINKALEAE